MRWLNKFQEGGAVAPQGGEEEMMQQLVALVQAAMSGDQQAALYIEQIMQAAQQGDPQAQQLAQAIQAIAQELQGGAGGGAGMPMQKCGGKVRKHNDGGEAAKKKAIIEHITRGVSTVSPAFDPMRHAKEEAKVGSKKLAEGAKKAGEIGATAGSTAMKTSGEIKQAPAFPKKKEPEKKAKGGCACKATMHRIGGRLVNIDCNGQIVRNYGRN